MKKLSTKNKLSIIYGLASLALFITWAYTEHDVWALLSIFYAITSSEYKIRADIEKGRE